MHERSSAARNARLAVRLTIAEQNRIREIAKKRGYASPSSFIRAAICSVLDGREELTGTEEKIASGFERVSREIARVSQSQQAPFALVDAFVKTVLGCLPEPPAEAKPQAIARAKERYIRLIQSAGQGMSRDAKTTMQNLVHHAEI